MRILCWTQTDVGQKRDHNEDSFLVAAELGLYVVADGMGGHAGGDQASQMAVSALHETIRRSRLGEATGDATLGEEPEALALLREGARSAGALIFDLAQENAHLAGMGTTLTALLFQGGRVNIAHVGDSRAYLFRDGRIEQLSEDHSWINEQVKAGLITDEEARHSKFKHIITRSVGFERDVSVDVMSLPVLMGDCFVVCSDGLSNYIESDELGRLLTTRYYSSVPRLLVDLANERGGDDNITVVLVYVANDSGPALVEDLSRVEPSRAITLLGTESDEEEQDSSSARSKDKSLPGGSEASGTKARSGIRWSDEDAEAQPLPQGTSTAVPASPVDPLADTAPALRPMAAPDDALVEQAEGSGAREKSDGYPLGKAQAQVDPEGAQSGESARVAQAQVDPEGAQPGGSARVAQAQVDPEGAQSGESARVAPGREEARAASLPEGVGEGPPMNGCAGGTPETSQDEPTPEAPQPVAPKPPG